MTVSEWADENRVLSSISSAAPGQWRTERTPYLREILDLLSVLSPTTEVGLMKGAQIGGTEVALNFIGYIIETVPGPILCVQPTQGLLKKFSRQRLTPAIRGSPGLRARVGEDGERKSANTIFEKEFDGGILMMGTARSATDLSAMPIRFLICDEVDRYEGDVDGEGDPIELARKRTATFAGLAKCLYISTPKLRGTSRIERIYEAGDQRRYYVPCPFCGHMDFLTWSGFRDFIAQQDPGHYRIGWEGEGPEPEHVFMVCGKCGEHVDEAWKPQMLARGEWRATSPGPGKMPTFHLSALYSPLGWYSWRAAVKEFRHVKGKPEEFQTWVNTTLGESWEVKGESVGWEALMARAEQYPEHLEGEGDAVVKSQLVPKGVGLLVAGVDVQADRLEWAVYGFGAGEECWLIATGAEPGDPAAPKVWLELDRQLVSAFPLASGRSATIDCVAIDAQYQTEEVYKFCRARLDVSRRVYPVRGGTETGLPFVGTPTTGNPYKVPLHTLCTDTGKGAIYARLLLPDPGPGYIHFPAWTKGQPEFFQQLTAEKAIRKWHNGRSTRHWVKLRERNEQLDMAVYAFAALYIRGDGRAPLWLKSEAEKWAKPPEGPASAPAPTGVQVPAAMLRRQRGNWVGRWRQ